jgi:hypothetical protein
MAILKIDANVCDPTALERVYVQFNALPWFENTVTEVHRRIADVGVFDFMPSIALFCEKTDEKVKAFFAKRPLAFKCEVDNAAAIRWCREKLANLPTKSAESKPTLRTYVVACNGIVGDSETLIKWADHSKLVVNWRIELTSCIYVCSYGSADDLANDFKADHAEQQKGAFFLVMQVHDNRQGALPKESWEMMNDPQPYDPDSRSKQTKTS